MYARIGYEPRSAPPQPEHPGAACSPDSRDRAAAGRARRLCRVRSTNHERSRIERDVKERVENLLTDVDREIASVELSLKILASSPSLQQGDLESFGSQIREALKVQGLAIILHDTDDDELVSTTRPYDEPPVRQTNRGMVDIVARSGSPHISNLFMGTVLQRPIVTVGVPVFRDEKVLYVLTMALDPARFSELLQGQNLSPGWTITVFDRKGIVVASNKDPDRFFGQLAPSVLREKLSETVASWVPATNSEGLGVYFAFLRSPITGWTVAIEVPKAVIEGAWHRAYPLAVGGGVGVLALSLALAWWMAQAIRRPVGALTAAARAVGSGARPGPSAGGIREIDQVADALRASADELEQRTRSRDGLRRLCARARRGFGPWPSHCHSWCGHACRMGVATT